MDNRSISHTQETSIAKQTIPITANAYITDGKELHEILATASLGIMPSIVLHYETNSFFLGIVWKHLIFLEFDEKLVINYRNTVHQTNK